MCTASVYFHTDTANVFPYYSGQLKNSVPFYYIFNNHFLENGIYFHAATFKLKITWNFSLRKWFADECFMSVGKHNPCTGEKHFSADDCYVISEWQVAQRW